MTTSKKKTTKSKSKAKSKKIVTPQTVETPTVSETTIIPDVIIEAQDSPETTVTPLKVNKTEKMVELLTQKTGIKRQKL